MDVSSQEIYHQSFDPECYLLTFFNEIHPVHSQITLDGLHDLYSNKYRERTDLKVLEIGCGPAIAFQISAAPHASEIVMADLVERNRDTVRLWLDKKPGAHNWAPFVRYVVQTLEGKEEEEVAKRKERLRRAITSVIPCDATKDPPVPPGYEGPYDVVLETALLDVICTNEDELVAALVRMSKLLKPGGTFVSKSYLVEDTCTTTNTHTYPIGDGNRAVVYKISQDLLYKCIKAAGFSNIEFKRSKPFDNTTMVEHMVEGATFYGTAFVTAVKPCSM